MRRELGDFQTPPELVAEVLETLGPIGTRWPRVLEPTCGRGHFLAGLLASTSRPREIQAIEIQQGHCQEARALATSGDAKDVDLQITRADLFALDLRRDLAWRQPGPLLVLGNPPWVTNAELGALASPQRPPRRNLKGLRGLDARTGSSNFDVTEAVWLKLALELVDQNPTIALLCKTAVARNVLQFAHRAGLPVTSATIYRINALRWFRASVDACLFCAALGDQTDCPPLATRARDVTVCKHRKPAVPAPFPPLAKGGKGGVIHDQPASKLPMPSPPLAKGGSGGAGDSHMLIPIYPNLSAPLPTSVMAVAPIGLIADMDTYTHWSFADGACPLHWRQGLKHDAAEVMELLRAPGSGDWRNRHGQLVDVEPDFVYPLVKGADLVRALNDRPERATLVAQKFLGEPTESLERRAPRLWRYFIGHAAIFSSRKSSIYRGQPPFSLFGVGPYTFAPYKVVISGMHKEPRFRAIGPVRGRPVILDDTCYFLPCTTAEEASILTAACNDPISLGLLSALIFRDAKRPITKKLLARIGLSTVLQRSDRNSLLVRAGDTLRDELSIESNKHLTQAAKLLERKLVCADS